MKSSITIALVLLLTACTTATPPATIDSLVINNTTQFMARDVTLRVVKTRELFTCSVILPGSFCAVEFPVRENKQRAAILSWFMEGKEYTQKLGGGKENNQLPGTRQGAVVDILDSGKLAVRLE